MSNDASELCIEREKFPPLATYTFSLLSENESADSVHSGSGDLFTAQQGNFSGDSHFNAHNLPYSPVPDPAHPWGEIQQQFNDSKSVETTAGTPDDSTSRPHCDICNKSFVSNSSLKRHFKTAHGQTSWVCTVKGCGKYNIPVARKDNFRRHCKKKHPTVNLEQFGL